MVDYANLKLVDTSFFGTDQPEDRGADQLINYNPRDLDSSTIPQSIINKINTFRKTRTAKFLLELILLLLVIVLALVIALSIGGGIFTAEHSFVAVLAIGFPYACFFAFDFIFRKLLSRKAPADSVIKNHTTFYTLTLIFALVIFIVAIPEWSVISNFYQDPQDWLFRTISLSSIFGIAFLLTASSAILECYLNSKPKNVEAANEERVIAIMNRLAFLVENKAEPVNDPNFPLPVEFIAHLNQLDNKSRLSAIYKLAVWFKDHPEVRNADFDRSLGAKIEGIKKEHPVSASLSLPVLSASSAIASTSRTESAAPSLLATPTDSASERLLSNREPL